jgi:glucokinase
MAENIARSNPEGIMAKSTNDAQDISPIERVFRAARAGDETVRQMLEERAYYLGVALTGVVNLFNPELILLGGIFSRGQDFFLEQATRTVRQMAFGGMGKRVRIQSTTFGWKGGVLGASALALTNFFY